MSCPICGGTMIGDGHTDLRRCEFAREEDCEGKEADAGPVYCVTLQGGLPDASKNKLGQLARECRVNAGLPNKGCATCTGSADGVYPHDECSSCCRWPFQECGSEDAAK